MPLIYTGKIEGMKRSSFDGLERLALQFIERKADGSLDSIQIKVPLDVPQTELKPGVTVQLPVLLASMDNRIYYRVDADAYRAQLARK